MCISRPCLPIGIACRVKSLASSYAEDSHKEASIYEEVRPAVAAEAEHSSLLPRKICERVCIASPRPCGSHFDAFAPCRSKQRVLRNRQAATRSKAKKKQQYQVLKDKKASLETELEQLEAQHAAAEQRVGQLHTEVKALLETCTCPKVQ